MNGRWCVWRSTAPRPSSNAPFPNGPRPSTVTTPTGPRPVTNDAGSRRGSTITATGSSPSKLPPKTCVAQWMASMPGSITSTPDPSTTPTPTTDPPAPGHDRSSLRSGPRWPNAARMRSWRSSMTEPGSVTAPTGSGPASMSTYASCPRTPMAPARSATAPPSPPKPPAGSPATPNSRSSTAPRAQIRPAALPLPATPMWPATVVATKPDPTTSRSN